MPEAPLVIAEALAVALDDMLFSMDADELDESYSAHRQALESFRAWHAGATGSQALLDL